MLAKFKAKDSRVHLLLYSSSFPHNRTTSSLPSSRFMRVYVCVTCVFLLFQNPFSVCRTNQMKIDRRVFIIHSTNYKKKQQTKNRLGFWCDSFHSKWLFCRFAPFSLSLSLFRLICHTQLEPFMIFGQTLIFKGDCMISK